MKSGAANLDSCSVILVRCMVCRSIAANIRDGVCCHDVGVGAGCLNNCDGVGGVDAGTANIFVAVVIAIVVAARAVGLVGCGWVVVRVFFEFWRSC